MANPSVKNIFFNAALEKAARLTGKPGRMIALGGKLTAKLARVDWVHLRKEDIREKFFTLGRLVRAYATGQYREIPWKTALIIVAAIIYFVNPLDMIPDVIPGLGLTDDFGILLWVYNAVSGEVDKFVSWERSQLNPL